MGCERVTDVQPHKHVADRWRALAELPALRDAPGEAFLSRKEVAALVGLAPITLARLAERGDGPPCVSFGERSHRYQVGLLRLWLATKILEEFDEQQETRGHNTLKEDA